MSTSTVGRVREGAAGAFPVAIGFALLAIRPQTTADPKTSGLLLVTTYAALAAIATAATVPASRAQLGRMLPLLAGVAAVVAARLMWSLAIPPRGSAMLAGIVTAAAISEEAFFRRLIYGRLERFGPAFAVVASAILFAVIHLPEYGLTAMPIDLGAGLLFGWQRWASGSWTVPAATHVAANLLAVIS